MSNLAYFGTSCAVMGGCTVASYGYVNGKVQSFVNGKLPEGWKDSWTSTIVSHVITATAYIGVAYFIVKNLPSFQDLSGTGSSGPDFPPQDGDKLAKSLGEGGRKVSDSSDPLTAGHGDSLNSSGLLGDGVEGQPHAL